jgi:nicotinate-nucleotide pyrophosphorylase (carboxylating)
VIRLLDAPLNKIFIERLVEKALDEDLGSGDITTCCIVGPSGKTATGSLVARQGGILCGIRIFESTVRRLDAEVKYEGGLRDGDEFRTGDTIRRVTADAAALLSAERVGLNFLQHLSGIATLTSRYVKAIEGTKAKITDTRKTLPGLRLLEKYAVRCGGGMNHRFNLSDMVLIKDNHIAYAGGITEAVNLVRQSASHTLKIEVEVGSLNQVKEALDSQADVIMLDNMNIGDMCEAVAAIGGKALVEASGNVSLENVREVAECGVDIISIGRLTHSAAGVDISLDFEPGV